MAKLNKIYLAQMQWPDHDIPVCAGTNKKKVKSEALKILRAEFETGPVYRGPLLWSAPIMSDDIDIVEVPFFNTSINKIKKTNGQKSNIRKSRNSDPSLQKDS